MINKVSYDVVDFLLQEDNKSTDIIGKTSVTTLEDKLVEPETLTYASKQVCLCDSLSHLNDLFSLKK